MLCFFLVPYFSPHIPSFVPYDSILSFPHTWTLSRFGSDLLPNGERSHWSHLSTSWSQTKSYPVMGVSKNSGTPKWMVYNGKSYQNGWFGGTPNFWKHPYGDKNKPHLQAFWIPIITVVSRKEEFMKSPHSKGVKNWLRSPVVWEKTSKQWAPFSKPSCGTNHLAPGRLLCDQNVDSITLCDLIQPGDFFLPRSSPNQMSRDKYLGF